MAIVLAESELKSNGNTPLAQLEEELVFPFLKTPIQLNVNNIEVREAPNGSGDRVVASKIVDYIYSTLYKKNNGGKVLEISKDRFDFLPGTHTLVAVQKGTDFTPVMATLRVIGGEEDLEFLELFEMTGGKPWPHQERGIQRIGEIGRLGLHPWLDILKDHATSPESKAEIQAYRLGVFMQLYNRSIQVLQENGVGLAYYILGRNVKPFLEKAGATDELVEDAVIKQTPEVQEIREVFSGYWHPDKAIKYQPRLYIAPWFLPGNEVNNDNEN